jgi:hypothetical protein
MSKEDHFGLTMDEMTPKVDEGRDIRDQRITRDPQSTEQDCFKNVGYFEERFLSFHSQRSSADLDPQRDQNRAFDRPASVLEPFLELLIDIRAQFHLSRFNRDLMFPALITGVQK